MSFASSHASGMASCDRESPESSFSKSSTAGASTSLWFAFVSRDWGCINVTCAACGAGGKSQKSDLGLNSFRGHGCFGWGFWVRSITDYHSEL